MKIYTLTNMKISKKLKLEAYKKACEIYPDSEDPLMQEYIHALRMGVQIGWIKCKQETIDKAYEALYILANDYCCDLKDIEVAKDVMRKEIEK